MQDAADPAVLSVAGATQVHYCVGESAVCDSAVLLVASECRCFAGLAGVYCVCKWKLWLMVVAVGLRGRSCQVSTTSTAQCGLRSCQTRLFHTQGLVGLQSPSLASSSSGKCTIRACARSFLDHCLDTRARPTQSHQDHPGRLPIH